MYLFFQEQTGSKFNFLTLFKTKHQRNFLIHVQAGPMSTFVALVLIEPISTTFFFTLGQTRPKYNCFIVETGPMSTFVSLVLIEPISTLLYSRANQTKI